MVFALGTPGKPGAGWGTVTGQGNGQGGREHGQKADQLPGYHKLADPAALRARRRRLGRRPCSGERQLLQRTHDFVPRYGLDWLKAVLLEGAEGWCADLGAGIRRSIDDYTDPWAQDRAGTASPRSVPHRPAADSAAPAPVR